MASNVRVLTSEMQAHVRHDKNILELLFAYLRYHLRLANTSQRPVTHTCHAQSVAVTNDQGWVIRTFETSHTD